MRRGVVTLVALVACGSPRETRPAKPTLTLFEDVPGRIRASELEPLPADLPALDLDPEAADWRWPLPRPPQLTPSGEISAMFGTRASWTTLCPARRDARGVDPDDAIAYLRAWCDATPDLGLAKALAPLVSSRSISIASAAAVDLATVLAETSSGTDALIWLSRHGAREPGVLDALAATYLASDRMDDARLIVDALRVHRAYGTTQCRRLFREMFVADRTRRHAIRDEIAAVSTDAVCARLTTHANCTLSWGAQATGFGAPAAQLDLQRCMPILLEQPELAPRAYLTIAAAHWPDGSRDFDVWLGFATFASGAIGAPRADELVAAAFTNAVRVSNCDGQLEQVRAAIERVPVERLRAITGMTRADCELGRGKPPS